MLINAGFCKDEWNLAFTLLHELGHHLKLTNEIECHKFALKIMKKENFKKYNKNIKYLYLDELLVG
jgi:beta-lactamase regulating signal transducer with metallopeptidase domain